MLNFRNIFLGFVLFFNLVINAQDKIAKDSTIELDIQVLVDDKIINDSTYVLDIINQTTEEFTRIAAKDRFVLTLNYNSKYEIAVGYKKTNVKVITVDTNAPRDRWYIQTSVKLKTSRKKKRIIAGSIVYDYNMKTFLKKKK